MISSMLGAVIFQAAGIKTTHGQCNFESLWWLVLVFHIITRMVGPMAASFFLIPNKGQDESLLDDNIEQTEEVLLEDLPLDEDSDEFL